ncbi:MAG: GGDEF domain-containing protein [Clostridium sp.]|uniref:GGDEF domain-containing protein n=1 Tax=Clostridium sp. TaxID=1506 RepID=UPI003F3002AA
MKILNIIEDKLSLFSDFYDSIRILDSKNLSTLETTHLQLNNFHCLDNPFCSDCLALKALETNKTFRKLTFHNEKAFLMTVTPLKLNKETFIVEFFSNVTENLILVNSTKGEAIHDFYVNLNDKINIDPLTKAYNRNFLFTNSNSKFSIKSNDTVSLIMLDLDFFKNINDTFGHLVGDSVLKEFSSRIMSFLKPKDYLYRYGGEEFLVILDNETLETTKKLTSMLKENLNTIPFLIDDKEISISCSMGVAFSTYNDSTLEKLLEQADTNLYIAKNSGRNKIIF